MNGARHYLEAERRLDAHATALDEYKKAAWARATTAELSALNDIIQGSLLAAQTHATLALTAATIYSASSRDSAVWTEAQWEAVLDA